MAIKRIPVETVADPNHGTLVLEGEGREVLPLDRVYVEPEDGTIRDGNLGHRLKDLRGNEIEIPRTIWY